MLGQLISGVVARVPRRLRRALIGSPSHPSGFANAIHSLLNRLPVPEEPVLACHGPLSGYRMKVFWRRPGGRLFIYGVFEPEVVTAITESVRPGSVAFDLGAYLGFYTLLLSRLVGPRGRVCAFEPLPESFRVLQENVAMNGCKNVRLEAKAVMDRTGEFELRIGADTSSLVASHPVSGGTRGRTIVQTTTLDEFVKESGARPDFLKIDVEGAEAQVLAGGEQTIREFQPALLIELHHPSFDPQEHPALQLLSEWGYRARWVEERTYVNWASHVLARPRPADLSGQGS